MGDEFSTGDEVALVDGAGRVLRIGKIERRGACTVTFAGAIYRFDGHPYRKSEWRARRIERITPEHRATLAHQILAERVERATTASTLETLSPDALRTIADLLGVK